MNRVALSASVEAGEDSVEVTARGSATSMGSVVAMLDIGKAFIPCVRVL